MSSTPKIFTLKNSTDYELFALHPLGENKDTLNLLILKEKQFFSLSSRIQVCAISALVNSASIPMPILSYMTMTTGPTTVDSLSHKFHTE